MKSFSRLFILISLSFLSIAATAANESTTGAEVNATALSEANSGTVAVFATGAAPATEFETVVTETKFNSSSRVVIDREEIEKSHARNITTLLATQANISIAQSNFQPTSIYLRGGDSSHVLILVDDVPFYDSSTVQRTINLNSLDINSVERIEIIKGSQSVLYGGQALSGVIRITTIPRELKDSAQLNEQAGSFKFFSGSQGLTKKVGENSAIIARAGYSQKDSKSPVLDSSKTYLTKLGTGELGYVDRQHSVHYLLKAQTSFDKTLIPTTAFPGYNAADTERFETSTYQMNVTGVASVPDSYLKPILSVSAQQSARNFEQDAVAGSGMYTKQDYRGELVAARFEMTPLDLKQNLRLKVGGNFNQEKLVYRDRDILKQDQSSEFEGFFAKAETQIISQVNFELGFRSDFNKMQNQIDTYQVGLTLFDLIKAEYSTGFKQPSLFQLFSDYGNINLQPEKSKSTSLSLEKQFGENFFASYTYFINQFENLIITRGTPLKYDNVQSSETKGHELALSFRAPNQGVTTSLNVGYQEPYDKSQETWLVRRPLRTASLKARKDFEKWGLGAEVVHNGDRRDRTGSTSYGTLNSYTLLNLVADFKASEKTTIFTRVQNVADQRYESSFGFYDEGLNAILGFEHNF